MESTIYNHYIAIDWSMKNMAVARMTRKSNKIHVIDVPADVAELQFYLKQLKGKKILTIEETTTTQWLYTELNDCVDKLLVCDPSRNWLLSEGPKTDKIDACKLVQLLKAQMLKEVYHSNHDFLYLRRVVSGYEDLIKSCVRLKNQRSALLRASGLKKREKDIKLEPGDQFVLESIDKQIELSEQQRKIYKKEFLQIAKKHKEIRHQQKLPGIGLINAVKIVARIVTPFRFPNKGHFLSYAGLIKLEKMSGGRSYGRKNPRFCRMMKAVYKSAVIAAIGNENPINNYYQYLIEHKNYVEHIARHKACRKLAILSFGVFKSGKPFKGDLIRQN